MCIALTIANYSWTPLLRSQYTRTTPLALALALGRPAFLSFFFDKEAGLLFYWYQGPEEPKGAYGKKGLSELPGHTLLVLLLSHTLTERD